MDTLAAAICAARWATRRQKVWPIRLNWPAFPTPFPASSSCKKATLSRSLSCPARGQQAVRVAKKLEASIAESGATAASLATVGGRIQKLLNHIGSPDHWSNWIRSLSPPQRRTWTDLQSVEPDASSTSRSRSRREPIDLDVDPLNISTSPCVPSVWLQMQSEHLAEPCKKSGSLPRSFQVGDGRWLPVPLNNSNNNQTSTSFVLFCRLHRMSSPVGWIDQSPSHPIVRLPSTFRRTPSSSTSAHRQSGRLIRRISIRPPKGKTFDLFGSSPLRLLAFKKN